MCTEKDKYRPSETRRPEQTARYPVFVDVLPADEIYSFNVFYYAMQSMGYPLSFINKGLNELDQYHLAHPECYIYDPMVIQSGSFFEVHTTSEDMKERIQQVRIVFFDFPLFTLLDKVSGGNGRPIYNLITHENVGAPFSTGDEDVIAKGKLRIGLLQRAFLLAYQRSRERNLQWARKRHKKIPNPDLRLERLYKSLLSHGVKPIDASGLRLLAIQEIHKIIDAYPQLKPLAENE